ncbi:MAG: sodium:solute symporter [Planctomycetes bacterium]|nr:sodium:solute symporter [Planctomycetota bacterium]
MNYLGTLDYIIISVYFVCLVGLGLYLKKKASGSMEDYFLGGRQLPWWALGISGMASFLDLTGTMIIVSFLYMMGPRGLFIEFRGGAVLVLAIMMLWSGKWHRRSGCITGAEWMLYRFGDCAGGHFARIAGAVATIVSNIAMIAYLIKGSGLFVAMFIPISPQWCAIAMIGMATIYILTSGFYGVVYTDIFQSGIIWVAVIAISVMAFVKVAGVDQIAALAQEVTGQGAWTSSSWSWKTPMPKGYDQYSFLFIVSAFYLFRNIIFGMGSGGEPRFFGAKNDKECGKLTFLWTNLMMFRWPMMMAFAVLGLFMVKELFPDQSILNNAAVLVKSQVGQIDKSRWAEAISGIVNAPQNYPPEFIGQLKEMFGPQWTTKMHLLSYEGTVDPERILPAVILYSIPLGFRGLILVALIAASLSTFGSFVNWTIGFFTRDVYQAYVRPSASNTELIRVSWLFGLFFVVASFLFAYSVKNINDIWDWILMALGGGLVVPSILRFYWWRFNGGGFAIGTLVGLVGAVLFRIAQLYGVDSYPQAAHLMDNPVFQFFTTMAIGLTGTIIGTYMTRPTDQKVLEHFFRTTRPFGFWGSMVNSLTPEVRKEMKKEHVRDVFALPFALTWQVTLFMLPMQLLIKSYHAFFITLGIFLVSLAGLYVIWLRKMGTEAASDGSVHSSAK